MDAVAHSIVVLIVSVAVFFVIFLLLREVMCWYWKINIGLSKLDTIIDLLKKKSG